MGSQKRITRKHVIAYSICPEDIQCDACLGGAQSSWRDNVRRIPSNNAQSLCQDCKVALCTSCWEKAWSASPGIPQALANDNFIGYPPEFLFRYKVRFIETACASPIFTTVVSFYVEADRGHHLEEDLPCSGRPISLLAWFCALLG